MLTACYGRKRRLPRATKCQPRGVARAWRSGWLFDGAGPAGKGWRPGWGVLLLGDLLWFSQGRNDQCDPALYYPEIPALRDVAGAAPGRIIGYNCFPANFAEATGLSDVRGYDAVDPPSGYIWWRLPLTSICSKWIMSWRPG